MPGWGEARPTHRDRHFPRGRLCLPVGGFKAPEQRRAQPHQEKQTVPLYMDLAKQKALPREQERLMSGCDLDQVRILPEALMKASMSALLPMEMRPTVGHTGQRLPAIWMPWALYIAPMSLADLVFQSTMIMLA